MYRKLLLMIATVLATIGIAFAQVDVNKADQTALESVKGIGPKISKTIIDERTKGGNFKDWADFEKRVKGIGGRSSDKLSQAGLTVNGQSKPGVAAAPGKADKKAATASGSEAKTGKKPDSATKQDGTSSKAPSAPASSPSAPSSAPAK